MEVATVQWPPAEPGLLGSIGKLLSSSPLIASHFDGHEAQQIRGRLVTKMIQ